MESSPGLELGSVLISFVGAKPYRKIMGVPFICLSGEDDLGLETPFTY